LVLLAVFRVTAWLATLIGSILTLIVAIAIWGLPLGAGIQSYLIGSANGIWAVDWITFWGVIIFNTLSLTGLFDTFKKWLVEQATADVRVQAILLAWALGALLEGLVGFGYPWAVIAPILIALGVVELDAIRVAAIANNAPVSYGALGAPIIALSAVTNLPLLALSASVGKIVAILALLPPWILIYLVTGRKGFREGWPLAVVGSLAYIAGQLPVSQFLGPYLPDIVGALVSFGAILLLLKVWRPKTVLGYGGVVLSEEDQRAESVTRIPLSEEDQRVESAARIGSSTSQHSVLAALLPFLILIVVVVLWTGPWSQLPKITLGTVQVKAISSISHKVTSVSFSFTPFIAGTAILTSLLVMVALSGGITSSDSLFGLVQVQVGRLLGFRVLLLPSLGSVGAEVGKPIAPQTASVGVSTSKYVRNEGQVIRHNMGWTLVLLAYLIAISALFYFFFSDWMSI